MVINMSYLWYGFINGFIFFVNNLTANWFWLLGVVLFILIYVDICHQTVDEFVDDYRDII